MSDNKKKRTSVGQAPRKRTISPELHAQWKLLRRKGDPKVIAAELGVSTPTIVNALTYGFVATQRITDGITTFFANRLLKEKADGAELKLLRQTQVRPAVAV
jgi:hypothetical protein